MLGPLEVHDGDAPVPVGGPRPRAVLAVLLASRGRVVSTDVLVDVLWGEAPPRTADHTLRTYVSRLRRVLGDRLVTRDGGYLLDVPPESVDACRFEHLAAAGGGVPALTAALDLWRGPAYAGQADLGPVRGEARRLEEARASAREALVAALVAAGAAAEATAAGEALVADEPYREGAWALLVRALVAAGRPAEALTAYRRAAAALDELGLEPSPVLRAAQAEALRAGVPAADPARTTPAPAPAPSAPPVPVPPTSLVGRDADLERIAALLATAPLVTLVGPGGVGKTRLALAAALERAARHVGGCRVIELAPIRDPAAVPAAVAAALELTAEAGTAETALRRAGTRDLLIVLDNCEHVIDAVAGVVETMLGRGPAVRLLATSRERLGVGGEHVHVVNPLPVHGPRAAAHLLFVERARAAGGARAWPGPAPSAELVERIVNRLDGLPLAIEMAAARTATLGLAEVADLLDAELDTLQDPRRRVDPRHRTLGAVIRWSEALLDDAERQACAAWPVFAGAVPLDDAVAVVGTRPEVVESLTGRSLLALDATRRTARYRMLQTVRATVTGPGESRWAALERRHAGHYADVATAADAGLRGPGEAAAAERLESVMAELRAAHAWARRNDRELAVRLTASLHLFAMSGQHDEVLGWAAKLVPLLAGRPSAAVEAAVAARLVLAGEVAAGRDRAQRAMAASPDPGTSLAALDVLVDAAVYEGRLAEAVDLSQRLRAGAESSRDPHYYVMGASGEGLAFCYAGRVDAGLARLDELADRARQTFGELAPSDEGWLAYTAGELVLDRDAAAAADELGRAIRLGDAAGNRFLAGVARVSLTSLHARAGDPGTALRSFAEVLRHWLLRGNRTHLLTTLRNLVDLLRRVGADAAAAELWGAVSRADLAPTFGAERDRLDRARDVLAERLGEDEFRVLAATGRRRDVEAAATAALSRLAELAELAGPVSGEAGRTGTTPPGRPGSPPG